MLQQKPKIKINTDQLLNCGPPLQNPLSENDVHKIVFNVIHHTPQQLKEMLPSRTTKGKSLHAVSMVMVNHLQML